MEPRRPSAGSCAGLRCSAQWSRQLSRACSVSCTVHWPPVPPSRAGSTTHCCLRHRHRLIQNCCSIRNCSIRNHSCSGRWADCRTSPSFPRRRKCRWSVLATLRTGCLATRRTGCLEKRRTDRLEAATVGCSKWRLAPRPATPSRAVQRSMQLSSYPALIFRGRLPAERCDRSRSTQGPGQRFWSSLVLAASQRPLPVVARAGCSGCAAR